MPINSRAKGKTYELEIAASIREAGFEARRGVQYCGGSDSPDVIGLPGFHVECKRVEAGNLYQWMDQASRDAGKSASGAGAPMPVVAHRRSRRESLAVLRWSDFLTLVRKAHATSTGLGS